MNTESIDANRRSTRDEVTSPGDFFIGTNDDRKPGVHGSITMVLPDSTTITLSITMGAPEPQSSEGPVWGWDGNIDKPTLSPSIHTHGHWHGHLRNGRLESC